jgi:hypothetical protein
MIMMQIYETNTGKKNNSDILLIYRRQIKIIKQMDKLLNFEGFINESVSAEAMESPELGAVAYTVQDFIEEPDTDTDGDRDFYKDAAKRKAYTADCTKLISTWNRKLLKVPYWGQVKPATFEMDKFADVSWSSAGPRKGAGVWNYATRKEVSKFDDKYNPEIYLAAYVSYDAEHLNFEYKGDLNMANKKSAPLNVPSGSYNGYAVLYKRDGENFSSESSAVFTKDELIKLDPNWKNYFEGLATIAKKYSI